MEDLDFGEDKKLIQYILKNLSAESKAAITEEILIDILDYMLDFYAERGLLDSDGEGEFMVSDMTAYILMHMQQDRINVTEDQIDEVLDLEFEYEEKI